MRFEKALIDLYAPGLTLVNYADRSLKFFARLFESDLSALIVRDVVREDIQMAIDKPVPGLERTGAIFAKLAPKYPWFRADPSIHEGRIHSRSDFCSDRQFRNLDIHSEVFRNWGYRHFLSMYVHSEQSRVVFFGFNRAGSDFTPRERELAALARPHLGGARHLARALSAEKTRALTPELLTRMHFTSRESDVLYWLTEGKSNVEIAAILHLQISTVKGYLAAIYDKIGAGNRHAAILHVQSEAKKMDSDFPISSPGRPLLQVPYPLTPTKVG